MGGVVSAAAVGGSEAAFELAERPERVVRVSIAPHWEESPQVTIYVELVEGDDAALMPQRCGETMCVRLWGLDEAKTTIERETEPQHDRTNAER